MPCCTACIVQHLIAPVLVVQDSSPNSMHVLLQRISEGLQGLGDSLSAAKNRIGHLFQELAAKIRNDTHALHPSSNPFYAGCSRVWISVASGRLLEMANGI